MTKLIASLGALADRSPARHRSAPGLGAARMDNHRCGRHMHWVPAHRDRMLATGFRRSLQRG